MAKRTSSAAVADRNKTAVPAKVHVDHDRYISRKGLEHLKTKLLNLPSEVELARQEVAKINDGSGKDTSARLDAQERLGKLVRDEQETEAFLRNAIVIEEAPEYAQQDDGIWFGWSVSYADDFGVGFIALLNAREREIRGHVVDMCRRAHSHSENGHCDQVEIASCTSALTQALLGHKVGDIIEYIANDRPQHLRILAATPIL